MIDAFAVDFWECKFKWVSYITKETSAVYYGLTKKKKYYIKVHAYKEINSVKEYGKWSSKKSVTIKK